LVNLAKQKKQEKRDHDIPFPLVPSKWTFTIVEMVQTVAATIVLLLFL
jgi:hypothetical protein